ncbi:hypothetical protein RQP46_005826 [Phenoliferia psychrophenolica]
MATPRACFASLPVELKVNVLGHVARQESNWKLRTSEVEDTEEQATERTAHTDALRAASLVNKEWWSLTATFIFHTLHFKAAHLPLFRHSLLHKLRVGHLFVKANLECKVRDHGDDEESHERAEALDYTLSILPLLPHLHSLVLGVECAASLWGRRVEIDSGRDDERGMRSLALETIAKKVDDLKLVAFRPREADRVLATWPRAGLRKLDLYGLILDHSDQVDEIVPLITSMRTLVDLTILCVAVPGAKNSWSPDALTILRNNPPPLKRLDLFCEDLHNTALDFLSAFSPTLQHLALRYHNFHDLPSALHPIDLPHLASLNIVNEDIDGVLPSPSLSKVLPAFLSSPITSLELSDSSSPVERGESYPLTLLTKHFPHLQTLDVECSDAKEVSFVTAWMD